MSLLDHSLALMAFGPGRWKWTSQTHPPFMERRKHLRSQVPADTPDTNALAAGNLLGMNDGLFGKIWEFLQLEIIQSRHRGETLSPIWKDRVAGSMAPPNAA